jgi:hypothetical protein
MSHDNRSHRRSDRRRPGVDALDGRRVSRVSSIDANIKLAGSASLAALRADLGLSFRRRLVRAAVPDKTVGGRHGASAIRLAVRSNFADNDRPVTAIPGGLLRKEGICRLWPLYRSRPGAASDLQEVNFAIAGQNAAAAGPTKAVVTAAGDEVPELTATQFFAHGAIYQVVSAVTAQGHDLWGKPKMATRSFGARRLARRSRPSRAYRRRIQLGLTAPVITPTAKGGASQHAHNLTCG